MRRLVLAALLVMPLLAYAQDQPETAKPQAATKLEAFSARTGIVVIKGNTNVGVVTGTGRVSVVAREFRDAGNPKAAQYGVALEVKEAGRLGRQSTSFIDEDEIDSLISGLEYISKIDRSATTLRNFEAEYRTKGDLAMVVFSGLGAELGFAVSSGRIGKTTAFLKLADADRLLNLLGEAKNAIAASKSAVK